MQLEKEGIKLPHDFTEHIPLEAYQWLKKYGLGSDEIEEFTIGWSDTKYRLIFPIYDQADKATMWTGRYFGKRVDEPRYLTMGNRNETISIVGKQRGEKLVLVEDRVSQIKVGKVCSTLCLFGSHMPLEWASGLSSRFRELTLWLDPDMRRASIQQALRLEPWFDKSTVIFSEKDPKCYSPDEIRQRLGQTLTEPAL